MPHSTVRLAVSLRLTYAAAAGRSLARLAPARGRAIRQLRQVEAVVVGQLLFARRCAKHDARRALGVLDLALDQDAVLVAAQLDRQRLRRRRSSSAKSAGAAGRARMVPKLPPACGCRTDVDALTALTNRRAPDGDLRARL